MIVTYNNNIFGFPARFPVTVPVPAVALTLGGFGGLKTETDAENTAVLSKTRYL